MKKKLLPIVEVTIEKLVHGGQGLGVLPDGRKVFVWNALPGEKLQVQLTKKKRDYAEGVTTAVLTPSPVRIGNADIAPEVLATQPWAIMDYTTELQAKQAIVKELFAREKVEIQSVEIKTFGGLSGYRNKMEYGFWGDDEGLSFAQFRRGSHGKIKMQMSDLANDRLNSAGMELLDVLNKNGIRGSQLKSVIIRAVMPDQAAVALFVKEKDFPKIAFPEGTVVYYSDPRSPASVTTKELYRNGDTSLEVNILAHTFVFDVLSFFQVNIPIFEVALADIKKSLLPSRPIVDMYAGVGAIGLSLDGRPVTLVEIDATNVQMARQNVQGEKVDVVQASTEQALEYVTDDADIIVDPPRSGLHRKVVERILEVEPPQLVYLSCNPATQARDVALLSGKYKISQLTGYNFFPRTPHIESLAVLERILV